MICAKLFPRHHSYLIIAAAFVSLHVPLSAQNTTGTTTMSPDDAELIGRLRSKGKGELAISYHHQLNRLSFLGTNFDSPIVLGTSTTVATDPEQAVRLFMKDYGNLFGIKDESLELEIKKKVSRDRSRTILRFQQVHSSVPVFGAELNFQLTASNELVSVNGEIVQELQLSISPDVDVDEALQLAIESVANKYSAPFSELTASSSPELWIFNPIIIDDSAVSKSSLVWKIEIRASSPQDIWEFVFVDASSGVIVYQFNQVAEARNRNTHNGAHNTALPGTLVRNEASGASADAEVNDAHTFAGDTYDYYFNTFARDSLNGAGMALTSTVRRCANDDSRVCGSIPGCTATVCDGSGCCTWRNASWNGVQMSYGATLSSADDVVGHEFTHAVTQFESNLVYANQSGAINEALSDIFGEFMDLQNGRGTDTGSVRWLIGEDWPGTIGVIRNMSSPPAFNHPDRMGSPFYSCSTGDSGGVHSNSGVANKCAFLMTDGQSFNGITVTALGIAKSQRIWYEAQVNLLTTGSNYQDLYNLLQQACRNLVGTNGIVQADVQQVRNAVDATEMSFVAPCGASPGTIFVNGAYAGAVERGTVAEPFRTLRSGYSAARSGVTIIISPGIYSEAISSASPLLLNSSGKNVTLQSPGGTVQIGQ